MDRNTLLAFFLIALVLLFTPKYMEIFYPPAEETVESVPLSRNSKNPSENLEKTNVKSSALIPNQLKTQHDARDEHTTEFFLLLTAGLISG